MCPSGDLAESLGIVPLRILGGAVEEDFDDAATGDVENQSPPS
jgi:hypothetical protein